MLFAEPGHPYDDPDHPDQWAWRYGHFELLYTPGPKTLTLSRGPKYSVHSRRSCRLCLGNGWWHGTTLGAADTAVPCPICPAYRLLFEDLPLWPPHLLGWLYYRLRARRRTADDHPAPRNSTSPGSAGGYSDEPPF
ncbi:hypothetical protein [Streptomyces noursei]|uniref:hypothetical protein n=1 Tax=Streptomyces noursei TaxID=1971 RepID=UPI0037FCFB93